MLLPIKLSFRPSEVNQFYTKLSFEDIYKRFLVLGKSKSTFCIAPTSQWWPRVSLEKSYIIKHHQWIGLSRADGLLLYQEYEKNLYENKTEDDRLYSLDSHINLKKDISSDEFWPLNVIYGDFRESQFLSTKIKYPFDQEQGYCFMYVYWDNPQQNSGVFNNWLKHRLIHGEHISGINIFALTENHIREWYSIKGNFSFVRKIIKTATVTLNSGETVKFADAVLELQLLPQQQWNGL